VRESTRNYAWDDLNLQHAIRGSFTPATIVRLKKTSNALIFAFGMLSHIGDGKNYF